MKEEIILFCVLFVVLIVGYFVILRDEKRNK